MVDSAYVTTSNSHGSKPRDVDIGEQQHTCISQGLVVGDARMESDDPGMICEPPPSPP